MKKVKVDLSNPRTIDQAIQQLDAMKAMIKTGAENLAEYLKDFCLQYIHDYAPGIDVYAQKTNEGTWLVKAEGLDIIFLEFGEGVQVEAKMEPTVSGRYTKGPKKISGLDELNRFKSGGYVPGSGSHLPPQMTEEDDEDGYDAAELQMSMVMYNAVKETRAEALRVAPRFFKLQ